MFMCFVTFQKKDRIYSFSMTHFDQSFMYEAYRRINIPWNTLENT